MPLGALYFLLFCLCLMLWGKTNKPDKPLNLWRFWLVQLSAIGVLVCREAKPPAYVLAYVALAAFIISHLLFSKMLDEQFANKFYASITIVSSTLWYVMTAFMATGFRQDAALIVLVPAILISYTLPGKWLWRKTRLELIH